jgi:dTDP-4-amino-4,6-dideoxygalactose transaminase
MQTMNIPFLDLKKVNAELEHEIHEAVLNAVDSGWYILGRRGEEFEENCKKSLLGDRPGYVAGCNSGTDALILSLLAGGVGPGDEVISVSLTAIPTICAIHAVGARPVFVDVDRDTWVMDVDLVSRALSPATKAVIPVHLYGNMVDVQALRNRIGRASREDILIIEDVAQAHGSAFAGGQAGTFGRFGAFSFYPSKNIGALGDGGSVLCHTSEDAASLRSLRNYGQRDRYHAETKRGLNSRLDEIQASVLTVKLRYLDQWNKKKAALMELYRSRLAGLPLHFQTVTPGCNAAWHLCVIAMENQETRDALMTYLGNEGIQTLIHYPMPTHRQKAFSELGAAPLPNTESLSSRILSLPMNTTITAEESDYIVERTRSFFA